MPNPLLEITADIKGALSGGVVAILLDRGTVTRRFFNGAGGVVFSYATTKGVVSILSSYHVVPSSDDVLILFGAVLGITGLVVAESLQRIARRILHRSNDIGDGIVDKIKKDL